MEILCGLEMWFEVNFQLFFTKNQSLVEFENIEIFKAKKMTFQWLNSNSTHGWLLVKNAKKLTSKILTFPTYIKFPY
jgi:hypothetical protein